MKVIVIVAIAIASQLAAAVEASTDPRILWTQSVAKSVHGNFKIYLDPSPAMATRSTYSATLYNPPNSMVATDTPASVSGVAKGTVTAWSITETRGYDGHARMIENAVIKLTINTPTADAEDVDSSIHWLPIDTRIYMDGARGF